MTVSVKVWLGMCIVVGTIAILIAIRTLNTMSQESNSIVLQQESSSNLTVIPPSSNNASPSSLHPMAIETLRNREYQGGEFVIEETLSNGINYRRYIVSYRSEGLKIYGLLTVPLEEKPEGGYPAVIFVHGHIPPRQYSTINSYPTYPLNLSRNGFVMFKPDLRGHGNSEGEPSSAHYSHEYVVDTLNAIAYLKSHPDVNSARIGYLGHSNGGEIGLRVVLVDSDIKAASFWAGVVGSYESMFETYVDDIEFLKQDNDLVQEYGLPSENTDFWNTIDPYTYLNDIQIPIEIQHGTNDSSVPLVLSQELRDALEAANKDVEYVEYFGDNHDIAANSVRAWQRSIEFFQKHL
jgi:dipeptidyl aminopeptidase/acylaminoacyl peptidase